ncbi:MAG: amidohydrolase family protein [Pirellulaceae bacterium]|nr:amidohydrolase family protein [Pirellulaceae bacterium]
MPDPSPLWALRARWVFPVDQPPLRDGLLTIQGDTILSIGRNDSGRPPRDLGCVALLPGLVNAHTHLEFSTLSEPLGAPGTRLPDWIGLVVAWRRQVLEEAADAAAERLAAVLQGLDECRRCGVTCVGEIATGPWDLRAYSASPPGGTVFHELLGLAEERIQPLLEQARRHLDANLSGNWRAGLSPHAPYTVHPELLRQVVRLSAERRVPLAMHVAETIEELELLASHSGSLVERLKQLDAWHPAAVPRGIEPADYVRMLADAHRALIVHGNYLDHRAWEVLARRRKTMSLVYCPRTHARFEHGAYPLAELLAAGVRVAVGTDSRASNPDLNLWRELRFVAQRHPDVPPEQVLRMGTLSGAEALGLAECAGSLRPGKRADLAVVELPDGHADDPYELLLHCSSGYNTAIPLHDVPA